MSCHWSAGGAASSCNPGIRSSRGGQHKGGRPQHGRHGWKREPDMPTAAAATISSRQLQHQLGQAAGGEQPLIVTQSMITSRLRATTFPKQSPNRPPVLTSLMYQTLNRQVSQMTPKQPQARPVRLHSTAHLGCSRTTLMSLFSTQAVKMKEGTQCHPVATAISCAGILCSVLQRCCNFQSNKDDIWQ